VLDVIRWLKKLYAALSQVSDLIYAHKGRHRPGGADPLFPADYNIEPAIDNAYDLGSSSYRWRNAYLSGSLTVGGVANVGSLFIGGAVVITSGRVLQNIASIGQTLTPSADNAYDLGSSTYRWRNAYFSGSLTIAGNITVSGTANVGSLQVAGTTVIDSSRNLLNIVTETLTGLTADPALAAGKLWFRSDLRQIRWSPDGSAVKQVYPADWGDITNKPSTFPPSAHASSHALGGSDPVSLDASQITSGRLSLSRMPTSATANRVLVVRTANADPTFDQVDWNTDIKNIPSTFPPSPHTHSRSDVTDFWSAPFWGNIPDKPSTFPPSAHASSHASGGSDPVSLDASQIVSGRLSLSRMPTSTVANRVLVVRTANADPAYDQVDWNTDIKNIPSTFPPSLHADSHKPGGSDPLFPAAYSILPSSDNAYDLGSSSYRWRNLYLGGALAVAGAANVGSLQIGGVTVIDSSRNLLNIASIAQTLTPLTDNAYDLGSSTYRWRNAYFSGAVNVGSLQVGDTTVIDSSRNLQNVNWISGVMRRDTEQEIFRCQNDIPQTFYFALRSSNDTGSKDHAFAPLNDSCGHWGRYDRRWHDIYTEYARVNALILTGSNYSFIPVDANTHHYLIPWSDGYSYIGTSNYRFYYIRGLTVVSGDIGFEDRRCLVCGREFKEGDAVVFKVRKVDEKNMQVLAVPVHAECNPHPLDPGLLREHEKMLTPNRSGVRYELNPPREGEFEVVSVTVEDEDTMMVNVVCGDGTALSFPAPVDADEETIVKLANKYYNLAKSREAEREAKIARGRAKLRREWRGFKAKLET
jgi:hypothetical protein